MGQNQRGKVVNGNNGRMTFDQRQGGVKKIKEGVVD